MATLLGDGRLSVTLQPPPIQPWQLRRRAGAAYRTWLRRSPNARPKFVFANDLDACLFACLADDAPDEAKTYRLVSGQRGFWGEDDVVDRRRSRGRC